MDQVKITFVGHACFTLEYQGYSVVLDPYRDGKVPGLANVREDAHAVYCSHQHDDHNYAGAVNLLSVDGELPFTVQTLMTDHDPVGGVLRGKNAVHLFRFGSLRVAHLGDLGRKLKASEKEALRGIDCLLIPVGGFFTIDADTAAGIVKELSPRVAVPMHYRTENIGFPVISEVAPFLTHFDNVVYGENSFVLSGDTPEQILVLKPKTEKP